MNSSDNIPSIQQDEARFKFAEKRGKLEWSAIQDVDMTRLQKEVDIDKLERLLQNVTFSQLEKPDLKRVKDKNIIKLFKLGQLTTEYLLFTHGIADQMAQARQREYETAYKESMQLQDQLKANQRRINAFREQDGAHKNTLKTYEALLTNNQASLKMATQEQSKCIFCLKVFADGDYLKAHYKKRHAEAYAKEGLENQENLSLMSNLLKAADGAKRSQGATHHDESDEFVLKLKEEVVDKFHTDIAKLQNEIEQLRRVGRADDEEVLRTLEEVRSKEEERIGEAKDSVKQYEKLISKFREDIANEIRSHQVSIVSDVEKKIAEVIQAEESKDTLQEEMVQEIRARIEKEFADQFEHRFNQLEKQLEDKEKTAQEAKEMLAKLQVQVKEQQPAIVVQPAEQPALKEPVIVPQMHNALNEQVLSEFRQSQAEELKKLEQLLKEERDQRLEQERKIKEERDIRAAQEKLDRQLLIEEAVQAAANEGRKIVAEEQKLAGLKLNPHPSILLGDQIAESVVDDDDEEEFFIRDKIRQRVKETFRPQVEGFAVSIPNPSAASRRPWTGGKQSQASAFEDDDEPDVVVVPPKSAPVKPNEPVEAIKIAVEEEMIVVKSESNEVVEDADTDIEAGLAIKIQPLKPIIKPKKLDDIIEDVEAEKEGTYEDPLKAVKSSIKAMAESQASRELSQLIAGLEMQLSQKPKEAFLKEKYQGKTSLKTMFAHTEEEYKEAKVNFLKQNLNKKVGEHLKGLGFGQRNTVQQLSKTECRGVSEEVKLKAKSNPKLQDVDKLINELLGRASSKLADMGIAKPTIPQLKLVPEEKPKDNLVKPDADSNAQQPVKIEPIQDEKPKIDVSDQKIPPKKIEEIKKEPEDAKKPFKDLEEWDEEEELIAKVIPPKKPEIDLTEKAAVVVKKPIIKLEDDEEDWVLKESAPQKVDDTKQKQAKDAIAVEKAKQEQEALQKKKDEEIKSKIQEQIQKQKEEEEKAKAEADRKALEISNAKKLEEEKQAKLLSEEVKVDQSVHSKVPVDVILPQIVFIGDSGVGKSSMIQQFINKDSKKVTIEKTKDIFYYKADAYQLIDTDQAVAHIEKALQQATTLILCYNTSNEESLTSLKSKWMPIVQKNASKACQKVGIALVGINFTNEECQFGHKVALFARGFQLTGRTMTFKTFDGLTTHNELNEQITLALLRVSSQPPEIKAESGPMSVKPPLPKVPEIEDIIKAQAQQKPEEQKLVAKKDSQTKLVIEQKQQEAPIIEAAKPAIEAKPEKPQPEAKPLLVSPAKPSGAKDDDYDEDFE